MPGFATTRWSLILKSGAGPQASSDALAASTAWPVKVETMHRIRNAWGLELSRSF